MSLLLKTIAALAATTVLSSTASAQAVVTQRELSLAAARMMAEAAVERCRQGGFRISVTIVDSTGRIRLFHMDDGAGPHTVDASFRKAFTARAYRVSTADFMKRTEPGSGGRTGLRNINNVIGVPGGLPIRIGDETIGGIGVAGAPGDQGDEACAAAAIARIQDQLK
jgi:uncharacterized protein GlcG (DUF336 family)